MSFILDALRRAEAERERGRVPDLQSVSMGGEGPNGARHSTPRGSGLRRGAALGVGALLVVAAGGWWLGRGPHLASVGPQTSAPASASPVETGLRSLPATDDAGTGTGKGAGAGAVTGSSGAPTTASEDPASLTGTRAAAVAPADPPAAAQMDPAAPAARTAQVPSLRAQPEPMPIVPPPPPPVAPRVPDGDAATQAASAGGAVPPSAAGGAQRETPLSATTAPVVVALRELPEDLRALVPPLTVSGSSFSDTRANRLLFLNGRMLREGDPLSDDVRLETIELRAAILSVRGRRFRIAY